MSTSSKVLGQITEKENTFIFYVRQPTAQVVFKYSWMSSMMWLYLVCTDYMLGSGALNNDYVLLTECMRSEADSQCRSSTDCSDRSQTDVGLPQTSYSTATRQSVRSVLCDWLTFTGLWNIKDSPLSMQNWVTCILGSWQSDWTRELIRVKSRRPKVL